MCRKCGKPVVSRLVVDGHRHNLQSRLYCLDCSPFKSHNTRKLERDLLAAEKRSSLGFSAASCVTCGRQYVFRKSAGHSRERCNSCIVNQRKDTMKHKAVAYKGGKCELCGYSRCLRALEFHHHDPSSKEFNLATMACRSWSKVQAELDKCKMYCANCGSGSV